MPCSVMLDVMLDKLARKRFSARHQASGASAKERIFLHACDQNPDGREKRGACKKQAS
jgi:hypothetical protein